MKKKERPDSFCERERERGDLFRKNEQRERESAYVGKGQLREIKIK